MKRLISLVFGLLFMITLINGYNFNATYSNLSIDQNGWCVDITTSFKLYNQTEYNLYKNDDEYTNYTNISSAKIKIYDGPFNSLPLILDTTSSTTGEFSYKFTAADDYLLEIIPIGNYNDYHELIAIDACKRANSSYVYNSSVTSNALKLFNKSYIYSDIKISINNTNMISEKNIILKEIKGISENGLTPLSNAIKSFKVDGVNTNFTNLDIEVSLVSIDTSKITKGYYYENNLWVEKTISINENKVNFPNSKYGIYAITSEVTPAPQLSAAPIVEIPITETATTPETNSENTPTTEDTETKIDKINTNESSELNITYIIVGIVIVLVLGAGGYMFFNSPKKKIEIAPHTEVLNSYNDIYNHAKTYVKTYKDSYEKDQIYRALETVKVPRDIIDKVFLEEYH